MIVMKFGGTSVEDAASIERVAEIIRARLALRPVVVVSAMGKTTRRLLEAAEASARGEREATLACVAALKAAHEREARRLVPEGGDHAVFESIDAYFDELATLLEGLAILGEVPPRGLDKILAYGELLSSAIVAGALRARGLPARLLDARDFIKTDEHYGGAAPLFDLTDAAIRAAVLPVVEADAIPVVQGFIGSTRDGATTTLGFEGSDYTAAILGAALDAEDIQIWKDVSGLMTADPALFAGARTVKACSFQEAAELTFFGAKVLHPKAIHPAARKSIPVHIYNSRQPSATGTAIDREAPPCDTPVKSIAYLRPVTVLYATGPVVREEACAIAPEDFLRTLLNAMNRRRIQPLLTAVSAASVVSAIDDKAAGPQIVADLVEEISRFARARVESDRAIISLVGEGVRRDATVTGRAFQAMAEAAPEIILHGSSPLTLHIVVRGAEVEPAIARLHQEFFSRLDASVFE